MFRTPTILCAAIAAALIAGRGAAAADGSNDASRHGGSNASERGPVARTPVTKPPVTKVNDQPTRQTLAARGAKGQGGQRRPARAGCVFSRTFPSVVAEVTENSDIVLSNGTRLTLAGVLTPHALDIAGGSGDWPIADDSRKLLARHLTGRNVRVAIMASGRDRYGRRPAHIWRPAREGQAGAGEDPARTFLQRTWLQEHLAVNGLARVTVTGMRRRCAEQLLRAEARARTEQRGLWGLAAYRVRPADDVFALNRLISTYQLVEGRVRKAAVVRGRLYLNFGDDYRRDFTASVSRSQLKYFERHPFDPRKLAGRLVRVRGWVERRGGPFVEIGHTHQIALIDQRPDVAGTNARGVEAGRSARRVEPDAQSNAPQ